MVLWKHSAKMRFSLKSNTYHMKTRINTGKYRSIPLKTTKKLRQIIYKEVCTCKSLYVITIYKKKNPIKFLISFQFNVARGMKILPTDLKTTVI